MLSFRVLILLLAACSHAQLQLKRISPAEFEHQLRSAPQTTLVLFCSASTGPCRWQEQKLASVAALLASERAQATVQMVDTAEWGGEALRKQYGASSLPTQGFELIVFHDGLASNSSIYRGQSDPDAVHAYLLSGDIPQPTKPQRKSDMGAGLGSGDVGAVLELTTLNFGDAMTRNALLFVLFYAAEDFTGASLHSNFSAAAYQLSEQNVHCRFAKMEVRKDWPEGQVFASRLGITALPDIIIFRNSKAEKYHAGVGVIDLVDVARWNAGNLHTAGTRGRTAVHEVEATSGFEQLLAKQSLVLLAFTTRWCTRCLTLSAEFDAASTLLAAADPPVALASVNIDNPRNVELTERFGVLSFPVGKIFHRGRLVGDFMGGSLAHEIVTEVRERANAGTRERANARGCGHIVELVWFQAHSSWHQLDLCSSSPGAEPQYGESNTTRALSLSRPLL